jgi:hypothetical protein
MFCAQNHTLDTQFEGYVHENVFLMLIFIKLRYIL